MREKNEENSQKNIKKEEEGIEGIITHPASLPQHSTTTSKPTPLSSILADLHKGLAHPDASHGQIFTISCRERELRGDSFHQGEGVIKRSRREGGKREGWRKERGREGGNNR